MDPHADLPSASPVFDPISVPKRSEEPSEEHFELYRLRRASREVPSWLKPALLAVVLILIGGLGGRLLFSPFSSSLSSQPAEARDTTESPSSSAAEADSGRAGTASSTVSAEEEPPRQASSRETAAGSVTDPEPRETARDREEQAARQDLTVAPSTVESNPVEDIPPPPAGERLIDQPTFTPFDTPPKLTNTAQVQSLLQRHYPPILREVGVGGSVQVWLYIDEVGIVQKAQVQTRAGGKISMTRLWPSPERWCSRRPRTVA